MTKNQQRGDNMDQNWMNHPNLSSIDATKLQMLQSFAEQGKGKSQNDMLPLLMMAMQNSKKSGMNFSANEISSIIEVLKMGKSSKEVEKIEQMMNIMKNMKK